MSDMLFERSMERDGKMERGTESNTLRLNDGEGDRARERERERHLLGGSLKLWGLTDHTDICCIHPSAGLLRQPHQHPQKSPLRLRERPGRPIRPIGNHERGKKEKPG